MSEYVEGVFGGQALKLTSLQRLKAEKENLQAIVLYVKKNESSEDFEYVYIHKTGAYIGGQDVVEVSIIGIAGEIPPEKEWVYDVATFEGDIVYINGGHTIDELLLLDYLPDIVEVESWHNAPLYDPEEIEYQYTLIEQTEEKITLLSKSINERIDDEIEELHSSIEVTSEKISSDVRKSLYSSSLGKISQDISGLRTFLPVESLQRDLPKGTELVIMDIETYNTFTVITSADTNKGNTQIPIEEASISISAESTIHLELSSVASKIAQLADSYTLNIEGDGVVTGFKSALGEDGVSDFVIQADKLRVVGTKNGQPFGEGKSIFEVDTDDEKIYLTSDVILKGNLVQSSGGGDPFPIPVYLGEYLPTRTYHRGDSVSYAGAVWLYTKTTPSSGNTPEIGSQYWDLYSARGADGAKGDQGPGIVFRGNWQKDETYYYTDVRRDVVKYNNVYWLFNIYNPNGVKTTSWQGTTQWTNFGATFDSVATKLLLAEDAFVNQTLNIGSGGSKSAGISSVGGIRFWAGDQNPEEAPFKVDGDGNIYAIKGFFRGEVIGAVYSE